MGVIDLKAFVRGLRAIDYDGPVTVEPMIQSFAAEAPDQVAAKVAAALSVGMTTLSTGLLHS